jgi:hypothetical protein
MEFGLTTLVELSLEELGHRHRRVLFLFVSLYDLAQISQSSMERREVSFRIDSRFIHVVQNLLAEINIVSDCCRVE